ncbi:Fe2+-dependent dioxygenase [Zoogloea sp.]|uniref:Fe2+-dependent dioxygenase n=1 Tax=Zoogloea sp. TaxID=49181 RepID=UPI0035AEB43D
MLLHIPQVLSREEVQQCREWLTAADWVDGRVTAGSQSEKTKNNLQLPESSEAAQWLRARVLEALGKSALFFSAALPRKIYPPLFNCYTGDSNFFGDHVDNAVRTHAATQTHVRTDLSFTLFFTDPDEYEGGELVIEDTFGCQKVKLPAGDMVLYPSSSVHRVEPVTQGARICCFSWLESMVRETERRRLLFELDSNISRLRQAHGDDETAVGLTHCYHNLVRMWAST